MKTRNPFNYRSIKILIHSSESHRNIMKDKLNDDVGDDDDDDDYSILMHIFK